MQQDLFATPPAAPGPRIFTVTQINERVRRSLEESFDAVCVEGEISNTSHAGQSGHWYFTLKDATAQLPSVMFRGDAQTLRFTPENGLCVRATGQLTLYPAQGKFQLQVRRLVPVGQGALELAFRQLKDKLQRDGLFDERRKRPLPRFPGRIALVTSPSGAAVRDMLATIVARWPLARVSVVPVSVQGDAAPSEITQAILFLNRLQLADVMIVGRGGGSLEDLWAFNHEGVARAIAASRIPVVSAVGHEVDFTIADFVADQRAATPTAAGALVVPDQREVAQQLRQQEQRLGRALKRCCESARLRLEVQLRRHGWQRPRTLLRDHQQFIDLRLERLQRSWRELAQRRRSRLDASCDQLRALGPRAVLARGYTYCADAAHGAVVARAAATYAQQELRIHFADGTAWARVHGTADVEHPAAFHSGGEAGTPKGTA